MKRLLHIRRAIALLALLLCTQAEAQSDVLTAGEILGRPTDTSVSLKATAAMELEVYVEYSTSSGNYSRRTSRSWYEAGEQIEITIDGLEPDKLYYYRIRHRRTPTSGFKSLDEGTFHTQRLPGSSFSFAVQADSHLQQYIDNDKPMNVDLYHVNLKNISDRKPDFMIDLGDTFWMNNAEGYDDFLAVYQKQRDFLQPVLRSIPMFFVLGNHEDECGWLLDGTEESRGVLGTKARKLMFMNPVPDGFYSGNSKKYEFVDLRENYYAWEWGNALFVVLDPYWHTDLNPNVTGDSWDWTLGSAQYEWLTDTLESSGAVFKFIFAHQVTGGTIPYGRGGVEAASHELGSHGSYEWGGENEDGSWGFDTKRPGWEMPVHDLMVKHDVSIFFHGHDHIFVYQELDGVVYQAVPQPCDSSYGMGKYDLAFYEYGDAVENSGYLLITVHEDETTVEYIRAFLPPDETEDQINGESGYTYEVFPPESGLEDDAGADSEMDAGTDSGSGTVPEEAGVVADASTNDSLERAAGGCKCSFIGAG